MKRFLFVLLLTLFVVPSAFAVETIERPNRLIEFHGSRLLTPIDNTTILTDASPTVSYTINTLYVTDVSIDITADKDCDIVITPLPDVDDLSVLGLPGATLILGAGGGSNRGIYSKIAAPNTKITVTKTEVGSTTIFRTAIRGLQQ